MAQDAPKRRFLSLIFLVSCFSKSFLLRLLLLLLFLLFYHGLSICYNEYPPILSCQLMVEVSYKTSVAAVSRLAF